MKIIPINELIKPLSNGQQNLCQLDADTLSKMIWARGTLCLEYTQRTCTDVGIHRKCLTTARHCHYLIISLMPKCVLTADSFYMP